MSMLNEELRFRGTTPPHAPTEEFEDAQSPSRKETPTMFCAKPLQKGRTGRRLLFLFTTIAALSVCVFLWHNQKLSRAPLKDSTYEQQAMPLDDLLKAVDEAVEKVRIYVYTPPKHLARTLELDKEGAREYFQLETGLLEQIRVWTRQRGPKPRLVSDPEEADFFWVPHTFVAHWIGVKYTPEYWRNGFKPFLQHIADEMPFFNRSKGRDHLLVWPMDHGPVCDCLHAKLDKKVYLDDVYQRVLLSMIHIGYHGMVGGPTEHDLSVYNRNGQRTPAMRALNASNPLRSSCFRVGYDIALPQWNLFHQRPSNVRHITDWTATLRAIATRASHDVYFRGEFWGGAWCSPGVRPWVKQYCADLATVTADNGEPEAISGSGWQCSSSEMGSGVFALCPAGWACWSTRLYDAIDRLALPLLLADPVVQPFERFLPWPRFSDKADVSALVLDHDDASPSAVNASRLAAQGGIVGMKAAPKLLRHCRFARLHHAAQTFRHACATPPAGTSNPADDARCRDHPVSRKLAALAAVREWFSFDVGHVSGKSAVKLFVAELYCRSRHGTTDPLCAAPSAAMANRPHGEFAQCT